MNEPMTERHQRARTQRRRTAADLADADERAELVRALALGGGIGGDPADGRNAARLGANDDPSRSAGLSGSDAQEDRKVARPQVALDGAQDDVWPVSALAFADDAQPMPLSEKNEAMGRPRVWKRSMMKLLTSRKTKATEYGGTVYSCASALV